MQKPSAAKTGMAKSPSAYLTQISPEPVGRRKSLADVEVLDDVARDFGYNPEINTAGDVDYNLKPTISDQELV